jgi:hypothetical protein
MTTQKRWPNTTYSRHIYGEMNGRAELERSKGLTITKSPKTDWITKHTTLATLVASESSS